MTRPHTLRTLLPAALALTLAGCANPGPPRPPSLGIPALPSALTAQRIGSRVDFTWNTPTQTTDKLPLRTTLTAILCRQTAAIPGQPTAKPACLRIPVTPGPTTASDPLPASLTAGPPALLTYRLEIFNLRNKSAGPAPPVYAAAGSAPPTPAPLHITATRQGARITWPADPSAGQVELTRILLATPNPTRKSPQTSTLLTADLAPNTPDPGGYLDLSLTPHATYSYTAQRVRPLTLAGRSVTLRSQPTSPAPFTFTITQPPATPTGLAAIPATGFAQPPAIDLSWEPNSEPDLAGYNVYRSDAPGQPFRRLNPTPLQGPAYRDLAVTPGRTYAYRVTAVDTTGNESPPTPQIHETLTKQP